MEFVLRTPLPGFTIETHVAEGTGRMTIGDGSAVHAQAILSGDPVARHFAASAALAADPQRIGERLDTLTAVPASYAVESPTPTGVLRTQVSPHGTVTMVEVAGQGPQWISERGPAPSAPVEHGTVWREVARVPSTQAPRAPAVAEAASTRTPGLPTALPPLVEDPAQVPLGVRAALGLDGRQWHCGSPDGARWLLWTTTPTGQMETPAVAGRPRTWPSEVEARRAAAVHGQVVQREAQAVPPALAAQMQRPVPSVPERSVADVLA